MKRLATLFTQSYQEMKQLHTVSICAMYAAISVVLGYFSVDIGPYVRIGFSGIPNRLVDYLFGPVVGGIYGGTLDILKYIVKPTGQFFPGFTFNAVLAGLLYGCIFYKKPFTLKRILAAKLLVMMICNVFFNTLWVSVLYGKAFMVLMPVRLAKNLVMWPIDSLLLYTIGKTLERGGVFVAIRSMANHSAD